MEPRPPFPNADDDTVELIRLGALEADLVVAHLRSAGIMATVVGVSTLTGEGGPALRLSEGSRVLVRRGDRGAAQVIVDDAMSDRVSDDDLAAQAEAAEGTDFGDGARL